MKKLTPAERPGALAARRLSTVQGGARLALPLLPRPTDPEPSPWAEPEPNPW